MPTRSGCLRFAAVALGMVFVSIATAMVVQRIQWLSARPYPLDYDGFYYLQELAHRSSTGEGYYHRVSPYFALFEHVGSLFGLHPPALFDLMVVSPLVLLTIAIGVIASHRRAWLAGTGAVCVVWSSDVVFYAAYGFPRQALAVSLLLCGIAVLDGRGRGWAGLAFGGVLGLLAASMHAFAAAVVVAIAGTMAWRRCGRRGRAAMIAVAVLGATSSLVCVDGLAEAIGWGTIAPWRELQRVRLISPFEARELDVFAALTVLSSVVAFRRAKGSLLVHGLLLVQLLCLLPIWIHEFGGYAYRLARSVPPLALCAAVLLIRRDERPADWGRIVVTLCVVLVSARFVLPTTPHPLGPSSPYRVWQMHGETLRSHLPDDAVIQAPHGVQFQVTYFLGLPSATRLSSATGPAYRVVSARRGKPSTCVAVGELSRGQRPDCIAVGSGLILVHVDDPSGRSVRPR